MKALRKTTALCLGILLAAALAGCASDGDGGSKGSYASSSAGSSSQSSSASTADALDDPVDETRVSSGEFEIVSADSGASVDADGSIYTIRSAGEYTLSGNLADGQVIVDAGDGDEVRLILDNVSLSCSTGAPILALNADEVTVKSEEGSYNTVQDARSGEPAEDEEYDAAIWSACDLKLTGKGTLIVSSGYDNGVKSKDDLSVKNVTLKVTSPGVALKGNDTVTVESGELILISTASDCIKTSNSDVSSKGNQRGTVQILGGQVDIYSACDGISAAYNVEISPAEDCVLNIFTGSYADGSSAASYSEIYLVVPSSFYSEDSDYYLYLYNDDDTDGVWTKCVYAAMVYSGRSAYYALSAKLSDGYRNLLVNILPSGTAPDGSNYTAASGGETLNASMNGYLITDISSSEISGDWVQLTSGSGSSDKTSYSSKGIKAANEIIVSGGSIAIYSSDDGLHANSGEALENGETSTGNISISGGSMTVTSADDGIHADGELSISGGYVSVVESHEGLEGNVIRISGGEVYVYGSDDGLNAGKGASTPLIDISGGYLEVTTPSGDTDAIDFNGSFTMSGGFVLVKGGASMGGMAGSVDTDGAVNITGGSIVALGGICQTPSSGSVNTYIGSGAGFSAGEYSLSDSSGNILFTFSLDGSYSSCWIASELLELGESYTLSSDGSAVLSWTQDSSSVGSAGNGGFGGMGGFGGRR